MKRKRYSSPLLSLALSLAVLMTPRPLPAMAGSSSDRLAFGLLMMSGDRISTPHMTSIRDFSVDPAEWEPALAALPVRYAAASEAQGAMRLFPVLPEVARWPREHYPAITARDLILSTGAPVDLMEGVTAKDRRDGDLTSNILVEHPEDPPSSPGFYYSSYSVENSLGLTSFARRWITILAPAASPQIFTGDLHLKTDQPFDPLDHVRAMDLEDGDISKQVEILADDVDMTRAGTYPVIYRVRDSEGNQAEGTLRVHVEWAPERYPRIQLDQNPVYLAVGVRFDAMAEVTAEDPADGDLTGKVLVKETNLDLATAGSYYLTYQVTNSLGLTGSAERYLYVLASSEPVLQAVDFSGALNQQPVRPDRYVTAYDLEDGNLADNVTWDLSKVDITTPGSYPVTFHVTDSSGNEAEATSTLTIADPASPAEEGPDGWDW